MQGAPGCALDVFIRNTVVDLCDTKTIQGELQHLTPLCKEQKYLGARGEKKYLRVLRRSRYLPSPCPFPPKTRLPCNTCWSELLLLRKWDDTLPRAGRRGHFSQTHAAPRWRMPCSIRLRSLVPWDQAFRFWWGPWQLRWAALVWLSLSITLRGSKAGKLGRNILHCLPFCRSLTCAWLVFCKCRSPCVDKILPTQRFSSPG